MAARIVVIGGGATGSLVALELQRAGSQVVLVEARHIGAGSSSRTAAGIRQQFSTPETVLGMRYAVDYYKHFADRVGGDRCPIVQNGYLFLQEGETQRVLAAERVAMQRDTGLDDVVQLTPSQTARRFSWVDPDRISSATYCPSDGFLHPDVIYNDAVNAVRARGGAVLQGRPITAGRTQGGSLDAVRVGSDWIEGDVFVDCTNAWSPRLARALDAFPLPVAPTKRYLWFIEQGGSLDRDALAAMPLVVTPQGTYCRPDGRSSLMVGFAHAAPAEPDFSYDDQDRIEPAFYHRAGGTAQAVASWLALADYLPPIGEFAGLTATTAGYYGVTPDSNPFLGFDPVLHNLVRAVGFSGHGLMFGPFTAAVVCALVDAGHDLDSVEILGRSASLAPFSLGRPLSSGEHMVI
ncbi:MAG: FAD-binding oxidoreductase [Oligoflexia bacterium]|nr:FAD-binding oxidoreductase [Oligoflexia bacterium]